MQDLYYKEYISTPGNMCYTDHTDRTAPSRQHELDHTYTAWEYLEIIKWGSVMCPTYETNSPFAMFTAQEGGA